MYPSYLTTRAPEHLTIRTVSSRNPYQHGAIAIGRRNRRASARRFRRS